ncbi:MAG: hypothetical protein KC543_13980 [Myxococcales bacterium]|nr:hypothetical protein [Myxococcales bacterium]
MRAPPPRRRPYCAAVVVSAVMAACAGAPAPAPDAARGAPCTHRRACVGGAVRYEAPRPTATGVATSGPLRPAAFVALALTDGRGSVLARGRTDRDGRFVMPRPPRAASLEVQAQTEVGGAPLFVSPASDGSRPYARAVPLDGDASRLDVVFRAGRDPFAGALRIVESLRLGALAVRRWTGRTLPAFFAYWRRGRTYRWSDYRGEVPAGSGRYSVELLAGRWAHRATDDADEQDDAIVLHEYAHFVMDMLSTDSSHGGSHPDGYLLDPGLAWEEGRATWFAAATLGSPIYKDSVGTRPFGHLRFDHDLERGAGAPYGPGSEQWVAAVLWDLADGAGGLLDTDGDPVALGPAGVLDAMMALRDVPGAYPDLTTFLCFLEGTGRVDRAALDRLLAMNNAPARLRCGDATARPPGPWPVDLALPGAARGRLDSRSNPAPSGGRPHPGTGEDAVDVYRIHLTAQGVLRARVSWWPVDARGRPAPGDRTGGVRIELRTIRSVLIDAARGPGRTLAVERALAPGYYVVYVRDDGSPTRARYRLRVAVDPPGRAGDPAGRRADAPRTTRDGAARRSSDPGKRDDAVRPAARPGVRDGGLGRR